MPKSRSQIQAESDARRGIKIKAFKLSLEDIQLIENTAKELNIPQNQLIMDAVRAYRPKA